MIYIGLSILFCIYGVVVSWKNSGTKFFLMWYVCALCCLILKYTNNLKNVLPKNLRICIWICAGLFVVILVVLGIRIVRYGLSKGISDADYVLVLGAQWKETGPSKALKYRLDCAYSYLTKHENCLCIVSGGQGYNEPCTEAYGMASYLINKGIASNRIFLEDKSTSTIENIVFSKKYIKTMDSKINIVSNSFHIYRAVSIAKKQGLSNVYGLGAPCDKLYYPNNMFREVFGIIKDCLYRNMEF